MSLTTGILPHKYLNASDDPGAYAADHCGRQAVTIEWAFDHLVDETLYVYLEDSMTEPWLTIDGGVDYNMMTNKYILCYGRTGELPVPKGSRVFASKTAVDKILAAPRKRST